MLYPLRAYSAACRMCTEEFRSGVVAYTVTVHSTTFVVHNTACVQHNTAYEVHITTFLPTITQHITTLVVRVDYVDAMLLFTMASRGGLF